MYLFFIRTDYHLKFCPIYFFIKLKDYFDNIKIIFYNVWRKEEQL